MAYKMHKMSHTLTINSVFYAALLNDIAGRVLCIALHKRHYLFLNSKHSLMLKSQEARMIQ